MIHLYLFIQKYISFGLRFGLSFEICYTDMIIWCISIFGLFYVDEYLNILLSNYMYPKT